MTSGNRGSMPAADAAASTAEPSTNGFYVGVFCRACEGGSCEHCYRIASATTICDCEHPGQRRR